jgi:hypothetical protein
MLRAILNAVRAAASSIWRAGLWTLNFALSLPGGIVRGLIGGGGGPAPLPQPETAPDPEPDFSAVPSRPVDQGAVVWHYARASVVGRPLPDLDGLAPEVRGWVERLNAEDLERIADAGISRTSGHIRNAGKLRGVPRVGDMIPASRGHQERARDTGLDEDLRFGPMLA